ncbi:SDR family oxidoreductase [Streptomyces alfalfae]|uniref:Oxidoreductase n=1 Tax=Streptomyces alfalfae TaxID=1642299 RepID=A0A1P8TDH5_9ACTN|nr:MULTISPECIES: SDR family oxidoreductase [Streptomyces]AYA16037.1 SDR family oxidoreductase [Streptomyces fradiae]APY85679.1 oxidoreductase [Streptomyces alfalfae]KUL57612.1 oxidoreductase [Streptomyces sp. NRRL S-1521]QQC92072.1 SDR family oxidoreductase [Streptomyces alfalfae]RXX39509.1 SDR family oxidoreductase [Streptomyces alfalfae]
MTDPTAPPARAAVVTGADSGIGRATAVRLAAAGLDVGITWHTDEEGAERTADEVRGHGRRAEVARMDLSRLPDEAAAVDRLAERLGRIDVLVNNAGTGTATPFVDLGYEDVRRVVDVDLVGPFLCGQHAARRMIRQGDGGRIVNVTSVHEHQPRVGAAPYCAAKGGLGLLTQVMALELAEHGITVNAVAPGEIATPMTGQEDTDPHTESRPGIPLGRPGDAREIAAVIAFLAGPDASYVTGASYVADGGMVRMGPQAGSHLHSDAWRRP